jgi:hypothetical protein
MAYTKTTFVNGQAPAVSAEELNKIGQGIEDAYNQAVMKRPINYHTVTAGEERLHYDDSSFGTSSTSYFAIREYRVPYAGSYRITFASYMDEMGATGNVYVALNGSRKSSIYSVTDSYGTIYEYDVTGVTEGDVIQIYARSDNSNIITRINNVYLKISEILEVREL